MEIICVTVIAIFLLKEINTAPVTDANAATNFLTRYGYLNPSDSGSSTRFGEIKSGDVYTEAIKDFQIFFGLNVTGQLDEQTKKIMSLPRCGVRDVVEKRKRNKRYILEGSKWKKTKLVYDITKYPSKMSKEETDQEIHRAYTIWSQVSPLKFERVDASTSRDTYLEVRFEKYKHNCAAQDDFDGPGNTLAHAFFPRFGGDAHFDDSESWTANSYRGVNLYQVAAHEFGHSLGLSHSSVRNSIMYPTYSTYDPDFKLAKDDIRAIQEIYGGPTETTSKPTTSTSTSTSTISSTSSRFIPTTKSSLPKTPTIDADPCDENSDGSFDTIFTTKYGSTYVFKGEYFWRLRSYGVAAGYPKRISDYWTELPSDIDTAFTDTTGHIYFFKGSKYWKYDDDFSLMGENYPKDINVGFPGIPDNVQASFMPKFSDNVYFFKGNQFWKYDPSQRPRVSSNYPKSMNTWKGIPNDIDDVFQISNDVVYFFKGGKYWKFSIEIMGVDKASSYPQDVKEDWFRC